MFWLRVGAVLLFALLMVALGVIVWGLMLVFGEDQ